ncbi:MAG: SWIM zinc finger family protein [Bacilli bacterium]|nr:SWIM zinc finger family protein [Bacilli bacterium]
MGLISVASNLSAWRGYEYYKSKKVKNFKQLGADEYTGQVTGSDGVYSIFLDTKHIRKSTCNCPHANGKRIICKHIVALYFEIFPKEADNYLELVEENEREAEQYKIELERKLHKYINALSKEELREALLEVLYDSPEWIYERFIRDRIGY